VVVRPSVQYLGPEGAISSPVIFELVVRLRKAVESAATIGIFERNTPARAVWREVYAELSEGKARLLRAMTSRAAAHVMRLSAICALLGEAPIVTPEHLLAALALWKYDQDSARFIFGDALGDPVADDVLIQLRTAPEGMTRTELYEHFGYNKPAAEILRALKGPSRVWPRHRGENCDQRATERAVESVKEVLKKRINTQKS
jgi:hypothetical protein